MRISCAVVALFVFSSWFVGAAVAQAIPDRNVNMVAGTEWPNGDPFLQRQNEPSIAVSTRNPLHLLAGANDYRTVDIPGHLGIKVIGDAWLGVFRSYDGGTTWRSGLFPIDLSPEVYTFLAQAGVAGADPVVRSGPNGLFYYTGLAFTRDTPPKSAIIMARLLDFNDKEAGEPIRFVGGSLIDYASNGHFVDKPWLAVDIPREDSEPCSVAGQTFPGHNVYVAYTRFLNVDENQSVLTVRSSRDCGATWEDPVNISGGVTLSQGAAMAIDPATGAVYVAWRRVVSGDQSNAIMFAKSTDFGETFSQPVVIAPFTPFQQGTTEDSFRTNAYPTIAVDGSGQIHVAWSQRGSGPANDGRIVISTSSDGHTWSSPAVVDPNPSRGHQFMPSLTFAGGKLTLVYYDHRQDHTKGVFSPSASGGHTESRQNVGDLPADPGKVFWDFLPDAVPPGYTTPIKRRHTLDVWTAQANSGAMPVFAATRLSQYMFGSSPNQTPGVKKTVEQLQFNPPNLPLFIQGTAPFIGDYLDVSSQLTRSTGSGWTFNTAPSRGTVFHAVWTDNRDVRPPADGNWQNYTPVFSSSNTGTSKFDGSPVPPCVVGQTGMRNQNIYTARVTEGLFAGSPGNAKQLGTIQRAFVVFVQNTLTEKRSYRLTIANQPPGGKASFLQIPQAGFPDPLTQLDLSIPPRSTFARTVFVTSTDKHARVEVDVQEITAPGAASPIVGGLETTVILNPDIANPDIANPDIANPDIANPDIANAEVYNPDIANPDIANPDIANPDIANPDIANPDIANPDIANPDIANPDIANPDIANPDIANPDIANPDIANPDIANPDIANPDIANPDIANQSMTDTTWIMTNTGNTTSSYSVNLLLNGTKPDKEDVVAQLILHRTYLTPTARDCNLGVFRHRVISASIPDADFVQSVAELLANDTTDSSESNATVWLAPGESLKITLRVFDKDVNDGVELNAAKQVTPVAVSHAINTEDLAAGITTPRISLAILTGRANDAITGASYAYTVEAIGGTGAKTWSGGAGLPTGMSLSSTGAVSGIPSAAGHFPFTATVTDSEAPTPDSRTREILFRVVDALAIPEQTLASGTMNVSYTATLARTGGVVPFTWSLAEGSLPAGLTLSNDGVISGTPTTAGTSTFTVRLQDGTYPVAQVRTLNLSLSIAGERTFVVSNTNDSGAGSLRQAILDGQANSGFTDTIAFTISGAGPHTIAPLTELPTVFDTIDGTTQPGYDGTPLIEIDGINAPSWANGLVIGAAGTAVRGLAITRWAQYGIELVTGGNVVEANFIGTADGTTAKANWRGVLINGSAPNVLIGGSTTGTRNVISGNAEHGIEITSGGAGGIQVLGNFIGLNSAGTAALPNGGSGVVVNHKSTIGAPGAGNVISGNGQFGVFLTGCSETATCSSAAGTVVQANRIGTNAAGTAAVGNFIGVFNDASNTRIGGTAPGAGNLISGNTGDGVHITSGDTGVVVEGNLIGTTAAGDAAISNRGHGIETWGAATIGGTAAGARNVISGNSRLGISIANSAANTAVLGNFIGTNATGTAALGNLIGIGITASSVVVGGTTPEARNLISGNRSGGIGVQASGNTVRGNFIGTDITGAAPLGNQEDGIFIDASNNTIGGTTQGTAENVIAFNRLNGIAIRAGAGNLLRFNQIHSNGLLGIDVSRDGVTANDVGDGDAGPNDVQNFPVLSWVTSSGGTTRVRGTLNSTANTQFVIDFFHSPACDPSGSGEGRTSFGSVTQTTDANGNLSFNPSIGVEFSGGVVTALAASPGNSTSEFSACMLVRSADPLVVPDQTVRNATAGIPYSHSLTVGGGAAPYTWSVASGTLPPGLSLSSAGVISGTCTATGGHSFTARVTDSTSPEAQQDQRTLSMACDNGVLEFVTQPSDAVSGQAVSSDLVVRARDTSGFALAGIPVTLSVDERSCESGFDPRTASSDASGEAHFGTITISRGCYDYALNATSPNFSRRLSNLFDVYGFGNVPDISVQRSGHTATLLPDGRVLVVGGRTLDGTGISTTEIYDPVGRSWTAGPNLNVARFEHTATLTRVGKVLITGGLGGSPLQHLVSTEVFDPATNTFSTADDLLVARRNHTATARHDDIGSVVIVAGENSAGPLAAIEVFDGNGKRLSTTSASLQIARARHTATRIGSTTFIIGGSEVFMAVELLKDTADPAVISVVRGGTLHWVRVGHSAVALGDGRILVTGGLQGTEVLKTAEIYDPATGSSGAISSMVTPRMEHASALMPDGTVILTGGITVAGTPDTAPTLTDTTEIYSPALLTFNASGNLSGVRRLMPIVPLSTPVPGPGVLVVGGQTLEGGGYQNVATAEAFYPQPIPLTIVAPVGLYDAITNSPYFSSLHAIGGFGARTWKLTSGTLPPGITLSEPGTLAGSLSGTPTTAGTYDWIAEVADSASPPNTRIHGYRIRVVDPLVLPDQAVRNATLGVPYSVSLVVRGGTAPYKWSLASGSLPPGLSLSTDGVISGTCTATGGHAFTPRVTDGTYPNGQLDTRALSMACDNGVLEFVTQPSDAVSGQPVSSDIVVRTRDTSGFALPGIPVTLSVVERFCDSAFQRRSVSSDANGEAHFGSITLTRGCYDYAFSATSPNFTPRLSNLFDVFGFGDHRFVTERLGHTATLLDDGTVLIAGGIDSAGGYPLAAIVYDPVQKTSRFVGNLNHARAFHTATLLNNGKVLIAGGHRGTQFSVTSMVPESELFDPATGTFTVGWSMVHPRTFHTATLHPTGKVFLVGGRNEAELIGPTEVYDPGPFAVDPPPPQFTAGPTLAVPRIRHTATLVGDRIVVIGGGDGGKSGTAQVEVIESASLIVSGGTLTKGRTNHTSTLLADGRILVAGGFANELIQNTAETYSLADLRSTALTSLMTIWSVNHIAARLSSGAVVIAGGATDSGTYHSGVQLFDPTSDSFIQYGRLSNSRSKMAVVTLTAGAVAGQVLIIGGEDFTGKATNIAETFFPAR